LCAGRRRLRATADPLAEPLARGLTRATRRPPLASALPGMVREETHVTRVLIVDDAPEVARALRRMLTRRGFTAEVAASGEEGLARLESFAPDVVISDHRMPGMNGPEFLDEVRRRAPSAVLFIISGLTDLGAQAGPGEGGVHGVLAKPWNDDELVARLRRALDGRAGP
jgi:two-component system response regulator AtoC